MPTPTRCVPDTSHQPGCNARPVRLLPQIWPSATLGAAGPVENAKLAMYQAKEAGRNACRFFDSGMNASVLEHLHLAAALRLRFAP